MGLKEIAKEEIPNWKVGNVTIKTFSYGDKLKMAGVMKRLFKDINAIKNEKDADKIMENLKEDADLSEVTIDLACAGIALVKNFDEQLLISATTSQEVKRKFIYDLDYEAGTYLVGQIMLLNKPITEEEKKESS